ncbi:MAG TPA: hypothetical protein DCM40_28880 [Maribacter sp.]|nr:hypothetical protein [Maribacter sp.]|tara:strand:+ start:162 stop:560 length:399 start_codon:yes stop_codon:yes gene_type:complete
MPSKAQLFRERRSKCYSAKEVLSKTLMSRYTLYKKVKNNTFPTPDLEISSRREHFYNKQEVDKWIEENRSFITDRSATFNHQKTLKFSGEQMKDIKTASKALGCNVEFFIGEAAVWKAKQVLNHIEFEKHQL